MTLTESINSAHAKLAWTKVGPWNEERIERLKVLWDEGLSCSLIAADLGGGVTRNGVIGKVNRLGLPKRKEIRVTKERAKYVRPFKPKVVKPKPEPTVLETALAEAGDVIDLPPESSAFAVSLLDVQDGQCRWPVSPDGEPFMFCGDEQWGNHSYCLRHFAISRREPMRFVRKVHRGRIAA